MQILIAFVGNARAHTSQAARAATDDNRDTDDNADGAILFNARAQPASIGFHGPGRRHAPQTTYVGTFVVRFCPSVRRPWRVSPTGRPM